MSDQLTTAIVSIATAVVGVALLATIVGRNSQTVGVINAASAGFGNVLGVALSPVNSGYTPSFAGNGLNPSFNIGGNASGSLF